MSYSYFSKQYGCSCYWEPRQVKETHAMLLRQEMQPTLFEFLYSSNKPTTSDDVRIFYIYLLVIRHTAWVVYPVTVNNFAAFFNCTPAGRPQPYWELRPKKFQLSWLGLDDLSLDGAPGFNWVLDFCCSSISVLGEVFHAGRMTCLFISHSRTWVEGCEHRKNRFKPPSNILLTVPRQCFCCGLFLLSRVMRKPVFGISDQVRLKPGCSASEAS